MVVTVLSSFKVISQGNCLRGTINEPADVGQCCVMLKWLQEAFLCVSGNAAVITMWGTSGQTEVLEIWKGLRELLWTSSLPQYLSSLSSGIYSRIILNLNRNAKLVWWSSVFCTDPVFLILHWTTWSGMNYYKTGSTSFILHTETSLPALQDVMLQYTVVESLRHI